MGGRVFTNINSTNVLSKPTINNTIKFIDTFNPKSQVLKAEYQ